MEYISLRQECCLVQYCESGDPPILDDYLVMAVSSFLSVYTPSGNDWHGVLVNYSEDVMTSENLTYTGN